MVRTSGSVPVHRAAPGDLAEVPSCRIQSYTPELGQGRRRHTSEATRFSASTDVSSYPAFGAGRVCGTTTRRHPRPATRLRQCAGAVDRLARARSANRVLRTMFGRFLTVVDECVEAIGSNGPDVGPSPARLTAFRRVFAKAVGAAELRERPAVPPECDVRGGSL